MNMPYMIIYVSPGWRTDGIDLDIGVWRHMGLPRIQKHDGGVPIYITLLYFFVTKFLFHQIVDVQFVLFHKIWSNFLHGLPQLLLVGDTPPLQCLQ